MYFEISPPVQPQAKPDDVKRDATEAEAMKEEILSGEV